MKKLSFWIQNITNPTPSETAKSILSMMPKDTAKLIDTLECLKSLVENELEIRESQYSKECSIISDYLPTKIKKFELYHDKPISEIEVDYELIKKV